MKKITFLLFFTSILTFGQTDQRIYDIINEVSAERIKKDIKILTEFGTRNTFSDTISNTRGIGAARRWIKSEFESISKNCNNCLNVFYQKDFVTKEGNRRVPKDAWVVNVIAVQKGTKYPNRYWLITYNPPRYKEYYKNTIQPILDLNNRTSSTLAGMPPFTL